MVKCQVCKENGNKEEMICEAKDTGELLQSGKPKLVRKYYHEVCHIQFLKEQEFRKQELKELDDLYQYVIRLHNIPSLDGRMMEKIQDLRNGTLKVRNQKVNRYKEGVPYTLMLNAYKYAHRNIEHVQLSMRFEKKWNEFAYCFAIMNSSLDDARLMTRVAEEHKELEEKREVEVVEVKLNKQPVKKKDDLDLSDIL